MSQISNRPVDWETLVKENEDRLYRAALAILGDAQEAEDAVQDTFLKLLEKAPAELDSPPAWLMRVLVNGCRDRLRAAWPPVGVPPRPRAGGAAGAGGDLFPPAGRPGCHPSVLLRGTLHRRDRPAHRTGGGDRPIPALPGPGPAQEIARRRNKMNQYKKYMDRQGVSPSLHAQLTALAEGDGPAPAGRAPHRYRWGILAACCVLAAGRGRPGLQHGQCRDAVRPERGRAPGELRGHGGG